MGNRMGKILRSPIALGLELLCCWWSCSPHAPPPMGLTKSHCICQQVQGMKIVLILLPFLQRRRSSSCNDTDTCKVLKIPIEYGGSTESDKTACGWEKSSASQWFLGLELVYWWWSSSPMRHHSDPVLYALLLLRSSPPHRRRRVAAASGTPPGLTVGEPASSSPSSS